MPAPHDSVGGGGGGGSDVQQWVEVLMELGQQKHKHELPVANCDSAAAADSAGSDDELSPLQLRASAKAGEDGGGGSSSSSSSSNNNNNSNKNKIHPSNPPIILLEG